MWAVPGRWQWQSWRFTELELRGGQGAFALIEVVGFLNLRADLLLVGRIMGAGPGAVYGLLYRVVDGFSGVVGSAGLWLYAEAANGTEGGDDVAWAIRTRSLVGSCPAWAWASVRW